MNRIVILLKRPGYTEGSQPFTSCESQTTANHNDCHRTRCSQHHYPEVCDHISDDSNDVRSPADSGSISICSSINSRRRCGSYIYDRFNARYPNVWYCVHGCNDSWKWGLCCCCDCVVACSDGGSIVIVRERQWCQPGWWRKW